MIEYFNLDNINRELAEVIRIASCPAFREYEGRMVVDIAKEDSNYIAQRFLDWFVDEQFEEVSMMGAMLQVVERAGENNLLAVEEYLAREGKLGPEEPAEA